jgi:tripartite-type tricarboxylate transporter receptor subunit TctC
MMSGTDPLCDINPGRRGFLGLGAGLAAALVGGRAALAQQYPAKPIRFIATGPAGGAGDIVARLVIDRMQRGMGATFAIENRPGAGTNIGAAAVARAPADGYTIGLASNASNAVNKWLYKSLGFDPDKDFAAIGLMAQVPNMMVVAPSLPVKSVPEFLAYAKAHPGQLNYGSVGAGSSQHLAGVQFGLLTGSRMEHIPYTTSGPQNTDLMEGRLQVLFQSISAVAELVRAGRMRALAVSGTERVAAFPDLPTLRETGVEITNTAWFGMMAPAGTPEPVLDQLSRELADAVRDPQVASRIAATGAIPRVMTRHEFAKFMAEESLRLRDVVKASGATAD